MSIVILTSLNVLYKFRSLLYSHNSLFTNTICLEGNPDQSLSKQKLQKYIVILFPSHEIICPCNNAILFMPKLWVFTTESVYSSKMRGRNLKNRSGLLKITAATKCRHGFFNWFIRNKLINNLNVKC